MRANRRSRFSLEHLTYGTGYYKSLCRSFTAIAVFYAGLAPVFIFFCMHLFLSCPLGFGSPFFYEPEGMHFLLCYLEVPRLFDPWVTAIVHLMHK